MAKPDTNSNRFLREVYDSAKGLARFTVITVVFAIILVANAGLQHVINLIYGTASVSGQNTWFVDFAIRAVSSRVESVGVGVPNALKM
jgi:hypothetical protein